jgi:hypothetical protein
MADEHAPTWVEADELPAAVIAALRQPIGQVVAIVATVDEDGSPRTAAFGSVRPITPHELRFGCNRTHATFANILRDGRLMVALFAPPDVAVGIRGRARVLKEELDCWPGDAAIAIEVSNVKNDALPMAPLESGITYSVPPAVGVRIQAYLDELEAAPPAG